MALHETSSTTSLTMAANANNNNSNNVSELATFCGERLASFAAAYRHVHGPLALFVCLFGLVTNILNMIVLTRRGMVSPTNTLLAGLAVADTLVMFIYVPFLMHLYLNVWGDDQFSYGWAVFVLVFVHVTQVFHTVSIWLTVTLAVCRYISIGHPTLSRNWCSQQNAWNAVAVAYIICPLLCIPSYLTFSIEQQPTNKFVVGFSRLSAQNDRFLEKFNFWLYGVYVKLLPCLILTVFSCCLIRELISVQRRRARLLRGKSTPRQQSPGNGQRSGGGSSSSREQERQSQRTSSMLLAILLLFLITELPQGILSLMSGVLGSRFHEQCYNRLGDVMDILALFNSSVNFIFYCTMSTQFRTTVKEMFNIGQTVQVTGCTRLQTEATQCTRV